MGFNIQLSIIINKKKNNLILYEISIHKHYSIINNFNIIL